MKKSLPFVLSIPFFFCVSCSTVNKKTQASNDLKLDLKGDMYVNIHRIAEALPLTSKEASDFFINLDSVHSRSFRHVSSQQFQYRTYTVFYAQPNNGKKLRGIGIDLDSSSYMTMEQLGKQLGATWHIPDLIEVQAGRMHYTADYTDSKRNRKKIHITVKMASTENQEQNSITFIGIDMEPEKRQSLD